MPDLVSAEVAKMSQEIDRLRADNARLREALDRIEFYDIDWTMRPEANIEFLQQIARAALAKPEMATASEGCTCQSCGRKYRVDLLVPDDLWERIKPAGKPEGAGLLCGPCIMSRVEALGGFGALHASAEIAKPEGGAS